VKATIRDRAALAALDPLDVAAYLRTNGWKATQNEPGKFAYWEKPSGEATPFEALLAFDTSYRDYVQRMSELMATLSVAEDRSQLEIYSDLNAVSADVIRLRLMAKDSVGGSVPLDQGVGLVEGARKLLEAAAGSAERPQAPYVSHTPKSVDNYIRGLRLGQTEIGSYVVTVLSRLPLELKDALDGAKVLEEPFERKVTNRLAVSLGRAVEAAQQSMVDGSVAPFEAAVPFGVNANLCSALADLAKDPTTHDGLQVGFSWSPLRPQFKNEVPSKVVISPPLFAVFGEAGRHLRSRSQFKKVVVVGRAFKMEMGKDGDETAYVRAEFSEKRRPFRVKVPAEFRMAVIESYRDQLDLRLVGEITETSNGLVMLAPESITLEVPAQ
jgi:hypothetical protein